MVWNFGDVLGCVVLLVLIKSVIVAMVMKSFGFSWEASTLAGACMAQVGRVFIIWAFVFVPTIPEGRETLSLAEMR